MIIVLSHAHPSVSKGGAEVSAYTLYLGLRRLGLSAAFVATCAEKDFSRLVFDTPDEYAIPFQPEQYDHFFHFAQPAVFEQVENTVTRLKPTTLIFHHFLFLGINTLRRLRNRFSCPFVLVLHEFLAICHHHGQMVTKPTKRLCSFGSATRCSKCFPEYAAEEFHARKVTLLQIAAEFDHIVSPSHFLAARFIAWGIDAAKMSVIENGLAGFDGVANVPKSFAPASLEQDRVNRVRGASVATLTPRRVFGYFGQINPFKGVDLILDAVKILEEFPIESKQISVRIHGNIVGVSDQFKKRFEEACEGGMINYIGAYDNADVLRLMSACDYILMASKWWENSPVVIQEAYAAQKPVIVPAIGGLAEKVLDGISGHHFIFNDSTDLARVLMECVANLDNKVPSYVFPNPATAVDMAKCYMNMLSYENAEFNPTTEELKC